MSLFWIIGQIIISLLVIVLILLQPPGEETGSFSFTRFTTTKRGWEKITFITTIVMVVVFILFSLLRIIISSR